MKIHVKVYIIHSKHNNIITINHTCPGLQHCPLLPLKQKSIPTDYHEANKIQCSPAVNDIENGWKY